jgi:hypothetical protein
MEKKGYAVPPELLQEVRQKIPRTVTVGEGYRQILATGLKKFNSLIVPKFKEEKYRDDIFSIKMRVGGEEYFILMWIIFSDKKVLDGFAKKVKSARDVLRKKYVGKKGFTYHVLIAIFRAWLAEEFTVNFKGR